MGIIPNYNEKTLFKAVYIGKTDFTFTNGEVYDITSVINEHKGGVGSPIKYVLWKVRGRAMLNECNFKRLNFKTYAKM